MTGGARAAIECLLALPSRCAVHKLHRTVHAVVLPCIGFEWVRSSTPTSSCRRRCATTAQPLTPGLVPEKRLDAHVFSENDKRKTARSHKNTAPMPLCNPTPGPSPPLSNHHLRTSQVNPVPTPPHVQVLSLRSPPRHKTPPPHTPLTLQRDNHSAPRRPCPHPPPVAEQNPASTSPAHDNGSPAPRQTASPGSGEPLLLQTAPRGVQQGGCQTRTRSNVTPQSSASLTGLAAIIFLSLVKLLPPRELMSPFFFFALVL